MTDDDDGNIWEEPEVREWADSVLTGMLPKMQESAVTISLVPESGRGDVKFWVELGASIMLDKPIIAVTIGDAEIPGKLRQVADEVVRLESLDDTVGSARLLTAALGRVLHLKVERDLAGELRDDDG